MSRARLIAVSLLAACATVPPPDAPGSIFTLPPPAAPGSDHFVMPAPAGPGREVVVVTLQYGPADEIAALIDDILVDHPHASIGCGGGGTPNPGPPHLLSIKATGRRLVLDGTPDMLDEAKELIARLDVMPDKPGR